MENAKVFYPLFNLVVSGLVFYLIYQTHGYLVNLERCQCAPQLYADRLKNLELFYLVVTGLGIFVTLANYLFHSGTSTLNKFYLYAMIPVAFVTLFVHMLFVYNAWEFHRHLKPDCGCTNQWEKDFILVQAFLYGLPIVLSLLGLIMVIFLSLVKGVAAAPMTLVESMKGKRK